MRQVRDGIDQRIAIPTKRIKQEMLRIFEKLTSEVDVFNAPSLGVEKGDFSYFFELQAMYEASLKSNEAHQEYIRLRREQDRELRAFKKSKKKEENVLKNLIKTNPALEGVHLNPKTIREFNKNANLLQRSINQQYSAKHEIRREIGRLEAWQRIAAKKQRNSNRNTGDRNRNPRTRTPEVNIKEVRQKAFRGDSLSLNELDALLAKGGIGSIGKAEPKASQQKQRRSKKRSSQRIDIRQGRTRGRKETRK